MAVSMTRAASVATVSVTVDVSDLIPLVQAGTLTMAQAKLLVAARARDQLSEAIYVAGKTDAELDTAAAAATAEAARLKALRPSGSF